VRRELVFRARVPKADDKSHVYPDTPPMAESKRPRTAV